MRSRTSKVAMARNTRLTPGLFIESKPRGPLKKYFQEFFMDRRIGYIGFGSIAGGYHYQTAMREAVLF